MDLKDFKQLKLSHIDNVKSVRYLNDDVNQLIYVNDSALKIFRDFKEHKALTVPMDMLITDVKKKLIHNQKDIVFVTNSENHVIGSIALHYLEGRAIQKRSADEGIKITDMIADDAKISLSEINFISYKIIKEAKVGHILNTLVYSDRHHIIVYDKSEDGEKYIRGYFSLAYIRRKLGLDIVHYDHRMNSLKKEL